MEISVSASRKKVVFLIDEDPYMTELDRSGPDFTQHIKFSVLRILSYFGAKNTACGSKTKEGIYWGFKFYSSVRTSIKYSNCQFYDYSLNDFENFESELDKRLSKDARIKGHKNTKSKTDFNFAAGHLSRAFAELVSEFQWERPDFLSPQKATIKSRKKGNSVPLATQSLADANSNYTFLFTPCPWCCRDRIDVNYFDTGKFPETKDSLKDAFAPESLYKKITQTCKIGLYWVDTGCMKHGSVNKARKDGHNLLSATLELFSGALIPIGILSSWWITSKIPTDSPAVISATENEFGHQSKCNQISPFSQLLDFVLSSRQVEFPGRSKLQVEAITVSLVFTGISIISSTTREPLTIALILTKATISSCLKTLSTVKSINQLPETSTLPQTSEVSKKRVKFVSNVEKEHVDAIGNANLSKSASFLEADKVNVKGVLKRSDTYSLLYSTRETYYCSFEDGQDGEEDDGNRERGQKLFSTFQQLLKVLKQKDFVLVVSLTDPEVGSPTLGLMQPWTHNAALLTILHLDDLQIQGIRGNFSENGLLETVSRTITKDLEVYDSRRKLCERKKNTKLKSSDCDLNDHIMELARRANNPLTTSVMQCFDNWFLTHPSLGLPSGFQKSFSSSKKSDDELQPRCNTRNLFSKLKECYKDRKIKPRVKDAKKWKRTLSWRSFDKSNNGKRKYSVGASNADACKTISLTSDTETSESRICDGQSSQQHFNNMDTKRKEGEQPLSMEETKQIMKEKCKEILETDGDGFGGFAENVVKRITSSLELEFENVSKRKEACMDFLENELVPFIRELNSGNQINRYLLQVNLLLEFSPYVIHSGETSTISEKVIWLLGRVAFHKDPGFVAKFLRSEILPRFKDCIPTILYEVYEGLMQDCPDELLTPSKKEEEKDTPVKSVRKSSSIGEVNYDYPSWQSEKRTLRRLSSIGGVTEKRREIVMPMKKSKSKKKKEKTQTLDHSDKKRSDSEMSGKEVVRNLFETDQHVKPSDSLRKPTTKLTRRHSEIVPSVRDTPACKQTRHSLWRKQHRARKRDETLTDKVVIKESPVKDIMDINVEGSRSLRRSQSFGFKSSPRRFYSFQRLPSSLATTSTLAAESKDEWKPVSPQIVTPNKRLRTWSSSLDIDRHEPKRRRLLDLIGNPNNMTQIQDRFVKEEPFQNRTSEEEIFEDAEEEPLADLRKSELRPEKPFFFSEDSMDWISLFGNEKLPEVRENSKHLSPTVVLPRFTGSDSESLSSTPRNAISPASVSSGGKQKFSSPFLSAGSLEVLENAPILSPTLSKEPKSRLNRSCRKKIEVSAN